MKKENLPLSEKQINKMRKGKMGSKLRIPFLVFTLLFAIISMLSINSSFYCNYMYYLGVSYIYYGDFSAEAAAEMKKSKRN